MTHRFIRSMAVVLIVTMSACTSSSPVVPSAPSLPEGTGYYPMTSSGAAYPACPAVTRSVREMRCYAWVRRDLRPIPAGEKGIPAGVGYGPTDLASAYAFDSQQGAGQTIAVIDAYQYYTAAVDLATYRKAAGLPPCTALNGCLHILNQLGQKSPLPSFPTSNQMGWLIEQSLDLDTVSAVCPRCHIILIEANTGEAGDLFAGVSTAMKLTKIVSMSWGSPDYLWSHISGLPPSGYALVASAGDFGGGHLGGPEIPCAWTAVICVGGTTLTHDGAKWKSVAWNDEQIDHCLGGPCGATGSGCSTVVPKPSWQHDKGCPRRSEADLSADAGVTTPLAVYSSVFPGSHWTGVGGTSLAAPLIAAMIALAGNATKLHGAEGIWEHHTSFAKVSRGTNIYLPVTGPCASSVSYICIAGPGYDGPTGWGSPIGVTDL